MGWVISNEPFWKGIKEQVNLFKLRASYGLVGNDVISKDYADRFPYLTTVDMGQGYDVYIGNNFERKVPSSPSTATPTPRGRRAANSTSAWRSACSTA